MTEIQPPFDKVAYCQKILQSKQEFIVLRELSILSCNEAIENIPDTPTKERDIRELIAQKQHFSDEIDGARVDIQNVLKLIEQYKQQAASRNE